MPRSYNREKNNKITIDNVSPDESFTNEWLFSRAIFSQHYAYQILLLYVYVM